MARHARTAGWRIGLATLIALSGSAQGQTPPGAPTSLPPVQPAMQAGLTIERAVALALERNPDLAVVRTQRGVASASVVIARTYPFNPVWQSYYFGTGGPTSAGITSRFAFQENFRLDLELRGQGKIRREAAQATLSRTEWEIATQELIVAVRTIRAFYTLLYRQEKVRVLEEMVRVQEEAIKRVQRLIDQGPLRPSDLLLARGDLVETQAAVGPARALLVAAWNDLRRQLGLEGDDPQAQGALDTAAPEADSPGLEHLAHERRPDLRALQMVLAEAEQRVRLEIANRYGNPSLGPAINYNETRVTFTGAWLIYQLPVLNTRRGDIMQRQAERDRAMADERRLQVQVGQDVQAARDRLREARKWVHFYAAESLPVLQKAADTLDRLFAEGEPNVDVLRPIDARRRLLRARDMYLDALWELAQARADLAAAVGDFTLALCPGVEGPPARPTLLPPAPHQE